MKTYHLSIPTLALLLCSGLLYAQVPSATQNYIVETTVKVPGKITAASLNGLPVGDANRTIQYFDGLGRPLQTVQWQGSPSGRDIVQVFEYDALGREAKKYLPYAEQTAGDGGYKPSGTTVQVQYYHYSGGWDPGVAKTPYPYSVTVFEPSPLNRVIEQGFPGTNWQPAMPSVPNSGFTARTVYCTNNLDAANNATIGFAVRLFRAAAGIPSHHRTLSNRTAYYCPGQLYLTISRDEEWTAAKGKAGTVEEYKDDEGRVVLKRTFNRRNGTVEVLSTYYVYDDLGNLSFVLPPGAEPDAGVPTATVLDGLCYQYRYDGRRRLIEKKIPGKGWEHMVYNRLDQLVLSQDSVQRSRPVPEWNFTKYDAFGRTVSTGMFARGAPGNGRADMQAEVDADSDGILPDYPLWETRPQGGEYTDVAYPRSDRYVPTVYTVNYYDGHDIPGLGPGYLASNAGSSKMLRGLQTGGRVRNLETGSMLLSVSYYDDYGRVLETVVQNHIGGTDRTVNSYNFDGTLASSQRTHSSSTVNSLVISNRYAYDHMGRPTDIWQQTGGGTNTLLSRKSYNEIGQLTGKRLHSTDATSFIDRLYYAYNERGWLVSFGSDNTSDTFMGHYTNGNIAYTWKNDYYITSDEINGDYDYDDIGRLRYSDKYFSDGTNLGEQLSYDKMGNITSMNRGDYGTSAFKAGNYSYIYTSGNRLGSVLRNGSAFRSYGYNANGSVISDGTATFEYNALELPRRVNKGGHSITYTYLANGIRVKKQVSQGNVTEDYVGGIHYRNGAIDYVQTAEGRCLYPSGRYQYNLTDHLGNVMYTIEKGPGNFPKIVEAGEYTPFGVHVPLIVTSPENRYLYNGKELQDELGLDQYDYGARFYDPVIGRWDVVDPLAEKMHRHSPYNYGFNNPIRFIDLGGMVPFDNYYINSDGSIRTLRTNDPFDMFFFKFDGSNSYSLIYKAEKNDAGLVNFNIFPRYGSEDAGGESSSETVGQGDHYLKPITVAALLGLTLNLNKKGLEIAYGDMSSSNGSDPWQPGGRHHAGHGHLGKRSGLDVDFRYLDNDGVSFQSPNAFLSSSYNLANNQLVYDMAAKFGFTKNFQGQSGDLNGPAKIPGHNDHGHLGLQLKDVNWLFINYVPGNSFWQSILFNFYK